MTVEIRSLRRSDNRQDFRSGDEALDVELEFRGVAAKGVYEERHLLDLGSPGRAGQQLGRREEMAAAAHGAHALVLRGLGPAAEPQ